jgi:hypothetical protein
MANLFVLDTNSLISYFSDIFGVMSSISSNAISIIRRAFLNDPSVRLSIPSVVFVEIFDKWFNSEEFRSKFLAEVFHPITSAHNIEIKRIDQEVLENFIAIDDRVVNLENHDKIILACAMMLECPLITCDPKIIEYIEKDKVIPSIIK